MAVKRLTPHRFRTILAKLGLTQVQAAHVLGVTPRTARRYALGETPIPNPVAKLLLLMLGGVIDSKVVRTTLP
jgi:transcriptional regulator with XRE-family HTH domain